MKKANTLRMTSLALAAMLVLGFAGLSQARGYSNGGPGYDAPLSQEQEAKAQQIFSNHGMGHRYGMGNGYGPGMHHGGYGSGHGYGHGGRGGCWR